MDAEVKDRRYIGAFAVGGLVVLLALGGVRLVNRAAARLAPTPTASPEILFRKMHLVEYAAGAKLWDLDARQVQYQADEHRAVLSDICAHFWDHGRVVSEARAPHALLDATSRDLQLLGGIRVDARGEDAGLEARELVWRVASHSLYASGSVAFHRGANSLQAPSLWADPSLRRLRLGTPVRARVLLATGWR